ncbi:MAG: NAD-dependent DNA ligase LigA [Candidatus Andersenbacteria bacterium]
MATKFPPKTQAAARVKKLREVISQERYNVHVLDRSTMSEAALDSLKKELFDLEQAYPDLVTATSPTQRVAGKPLPQFTKVAHPTRILSLNDAFSGEDLAEWEERIKKLLPKSRPEYFCELKIDGIDIVLRYRDGVFVSGATRGDGSIGEDVTANLKTIDAIPLELDLAAYEKKFKKKLPRDVYVQGEIYFPTKEFERVNREQEKLGKPTYANPRNTAAGSIRQLDPTITASRHLSIFVFNILTDLGLETHEQLHGAAKLLGFPVEPNSTAAGSLADVEKFLATWDSQRKKLKYWTDGAVVQVSDLATFRELGVVGKAPRGAEAYKFPAEEATTVVRAVEVSIGRTGALTPIAIMDPVKIAGTTVSRAAMHNEDEVKRLDLRIGDTVILRKAGDIIPEVVRVLTKLRPRSAKPWRMPTTCPMCGGKVVRREGEAAHYCANPTCFAVDREKVIHMIVAFDIYYVGPKLVDKLFDAELITDAADIFALEVGDLESLPGFGPIAAKRAFGAIQAKKTIELARLLYGLGIRHVGGETAFDVARFVVDRWHKERTAQPSLADVANLLGSLSLEDWQKVEGIGSVVAQSLHEGFKSKGVRSMLRKLEKAGVTVTLPKRVSSKLTGKTFVLTGTLDGYSREVAKQKILDRGGHVASSVSAETDYVVVGEEPGSKLRKAEKLGIKLLDEAAFRKLLGS